MLSDFVLSAEERPRLRRLRCWQLRPPYCCKAGWVAALGDRSVSERVIVLDDRVAKVKGPRGDGRHRDMRK